MYHPASNRAVERFNRVLKSCMQNAILQAAPWKETVTEFLHTYQVTPHTMMGVSLFELMYGRKMRTKLDILPLLTCVNRDAEVRQRVSISQSQMKTYCDTKRAPRTPRKTHVPKGHSKFTDPNEIQKQVSPCTYGLSDRKLWHSSHLTHVPDATVMPPDQPWAGTAEDLGPHL